MKFTQNTARRARSYMKAYINNSAKSYLMIEKFVKIHKCHRNILDQETRFLNILRSKIEKYMNEINEEKKLIELEENERKLKLEKLEAENEKIEK